MEANVGRASPIALLTSVPRAMPRVPRLPNINLDRSIFPLSLASFQLCKEPIGADAKFRADKEKQPICEKCGV